MSAQTFGIRLIPTTTMHSWIIADFTVPFFCGGVQCFVWDRHTVIAVAALHRHLLVVWGPAETVNLHLKCGPFRFSSYLLVCKYCSSSKLCTVFVSCFFLETCTPLVWLYHITQLAKDNAKKSTSARWLLHLYSRPSDLKLLVACPETCFLLHFTAMSEVKHAPLFTIWTYST